MGRRSLSDDEIRQIASEEGIDPAYLLAIRDKEGSSDSDVSSAGAKGKFQLLDTTFKALLPSGDINSPVDNARAAARYIKEGLQKTGGDFQKAAAYYYAGPGWQTKVSQSPGKKYGTNPDGSKGISIEDYSRNAAMYAERYSDSGTMAPEEVGDPSLLASSNSTPDKTLSLARQADEQLGKVQSASVTLSDKLKENLSKQVAGVRREGELESTVKLEEFRQQSQKAGENAALLSNLGLNTSDIDPLVAQISTSMVEDYKSAQALRDSINEKKSVGLLDSPLDYLINQFSLPSEIRAHNALIDRIASQKRFVDQTTSFASNVSAVNATKFTSTTMAGAQAAADLLKQKAEDTSLKIEDQLLKTDFDTQYRTLQIIQQRMTNMSILETAEQNRAIKRTQAEAKEAEAERVRLDNNMVNVSAKVLGLDIPDRKTLKNSPKDIQTAVEYIMANGGGIGKDPLEAWQHLARGNPRDMPVTVKYMRDSLDAIKREAQTTVLKDPLNKTANGKQMQEALSTEMAKTFNTYAANPNKSITPTFNETVDNPYHRPAPEVMTKIPDARRLPISKIIDDHTKALPTVPVTDTLIVELAFANVGKYYKNITEAAKDVSTYYQKAVDFNNEKFKFDQFGLPAQMQYKVKGMDLTNPADLTRYYISQEKKKYFKDWARGSMPEQTMDRVPGAN